MRKLLVFGTMGVVLVLVSGCFSAYQLPIPPELNSQINSNLTFSQLSESPDTHKGDLILLGGEVLSSKRLKDQTRLILLQLPLTDYQDPTMDRTQSEGRFIAFQSEFLDPATIPSGTRVTLVGEMSGVTTEPLDEMEYTYPTLSIKYLKIWPNPMQPPYGYGPYGYPYYPYPYYPYPYYPYYPYPYYPYPYYPYHYPFFGPYW